MGSQCGCCFESQRPPHEQFFSSLDGERERAAPAEDDLTDPKKVNNNRGDGRHGGRRGGNARIGNIKSTLVFSKAEEHLNFHRRDRTKGKGTKELIRKAVKQDRACSLLEEDEIENILETMEYYEFEAGDPIVRQGDVGTTFFVTHTGTMEVQVNDRVVNTMQRGKAFGGLALLYKCPRTASVTSKTASGAWGAQGENFHRILQEAAKKGFAENRRFLNSIKLFDVFDDNQKDLIGEACYVEIITAGTRVITEGEPATAMYFVKSGTLTIYEAATIDNAGRVSGGLEVGTVDEQECFGEDALLNEQQQPHTIVAVNRCELLCISGDQLKEILGRDLRACLEQNFILSFVKRSPVMGQFSSTQQHAVVNAMEIKNFDAGECIPSGLGFAVVLTGEITGENMDLPVTLQRGSWYEQDTLIESVEHGIRSRTSTESGFGVPRRSTRSIRTEGSQFVSRAHICATTSDGAADNGLYRNTSPSADEHQCTASEPVHVAGSLSERSGDRRSEGSKKSVRVSEVSGILTSTKSEKGFDKLDDARGGLKDLQATFLGTRIALLTEDGMANVLKRLGLSAVGTAEEAEDYGRKMMILKRVRIFRHLSQDAKDKLVHAILLQTYEKNDYVMKQGERGDQLFLISSGTVDRYIDGKFVKTMRKNQFFGERVLLFDEPRSSTVQVMSDTAEMWYITRRDFQTVVKARMQEELIHRLGLADSSIELKDLKHVRVVGSGSAGTVRLVEHRKTKIRYALKRIHKRRGKIPEEVTRECNLLAGQEHPFIMQLIKTYETEKSVYLLTELISGGELHAAIRSIPTVLVRPQIQFYGGSLLLVLEYISEKNIVFRDLKPENVMLDGHGYLKLIDFGIAKKLEEGKTRTFTMIGTPHYMAPETMKGKGYGTEVDIWAFGIMIYEFGVGFLPFADQLEDATEICAAVLKDPLVFSPEYRDVDGKALIEGLLCRQPKKRLGAGLHGYEDIKEHDFFTDALPDSSLLFNRIIGKELDAPIQPQKENFLSEEDLAGVTLSDADELAT